MPVDIKIQFVKGNLVTDCRGENRPSKESGDHHRTIIERERVPDDVAADLLPLMERFNALTGEQSKLLETIATLAGISTSIVDMGINALMGENCDDGKVTGIQVRVFDSD